MSDKKDEDGSGIDRRTVLKGLGATAVSGAGITATSQPAAAYSPSYTPDWYATHGGDGYTGSRCLEWTTAWTCRSEPLMREIIPGKEGYKLCSREAKESTLAYETTEEDLQSGLKWEHSTTGPSSGDEVIVWAHGWQDGGWSVFSDGGSAGESVNHGMQQCDFAWDAIEDRTSVDVDSVDHTIGWAWNSASARANFRGAVGQAHKYGPRNYSTFVLDLAERIYPGGTLHLGAHSLGAWMTLEGLADAFYREGSPKLESVLDSVRFICGAVPSSATGGDGGDPDWTNLEGYWTYDTYDEFSTYDYNALQLPNKVINGYYDCDEVLSTTCCWSWWPGCGPFRLYVKNFHNGSSSEAIGTRPKTDTLSSDVADKWTNKNMSYMTPYVESHTGSYKHPDYSDEAGGGQVSVWGLGLDGGGGGGGGDNDIIRIQ